jgi:hypothetical protein
MWGQPPSAVRPSQARREIYRLGQAFGVAQALPAVRKKLLAHAFGWRSASSAAKRIREGKRASAPEGHLAKTHSRLATLAFA